MNAYQLLIRQDLAEAQRRSRGLIPLAQQQTNQQVLASPEFESAVGELTGDVINRAREELARDPAYQEQRRSQDVEYQARVAQEAQARATAEAEARAMAEAQKAQAREQARAEAEARGRQAEADRAEVARLEAEAQARQEATAGEQSSIEALEKVFKDKKELAKIPEPDKSKVKVLMKAVEKGKIALLTITQLAKFKAKKLALEAELRALPAGKASKKRKAEIEDDLELMPPRTG
jgi:hypothetical protein